MTAARELAAALDRARAAAPSWAALEPRERGRVLVQAVRHLDQRRADLAGASSARDPAAARAEAGAAADRLLALAGWADKLAPLLAAPLGAAGMRGTALLAPRGTVLVSVPARPALLALTSLAGAALAAGSTVVALVRAAAPAEALLAALGSAAAPEGAFAFVEEEHRSEDEDGALIARALEASGADAIVIAEPSPSIAATARARGATILDIKPSAWHASTLASLTAFTPFVTRRTIWRAGSSR